MNQINVKQESMCVHHFHNSELIIFTDVINKRSLKTRLKMKSEEN